MKLFASVILGVSAIISAALIGNGLTDLRTGDRYVTVKGVAEREVNADLALWPVNFSVSGDSLDRLQSDIEAQQGLVRSFLLLKGFTEADIQLSVPKIVDQHANSYGANLPPERYRAEVTVLVRTQDVDAVKAGMQSVGELVKSGVALTQSYEFQPSFIFTQLESIKPEMIADATADARAAADQFARDSGSKVGSIRRATQGYFSINDVDPFTPEVKRIRVVTNIDYSLE